MYTCIILHNMIIQDEGRAISPEFFPAEQHRSYDPLNTHEESLQITRKICNKTTHLRLKADLVEFLCYKGRESPRGSPIPIGDVDVDIKQFPDWGEDGDENGECKTGMG